MELVKWIHDWFGRIRVIVILPLLFFMMMTTVVNTKAGDLSGTVTDGSIGISGMFVYVYLHNSSSYIDFASTDATGGYTFTGLAAGDYKVEFDGVSVGYIKEWYSDKADFASADLISVSDPGNTINIDAVLELGGGISGTVTDGSTGVSNVGVSVYDSGITSRIGFAWTDINGGFTVLGLPVGDYKVEFDGSSAGYFTEWYNDQPDSASADLVSVTVPVTTPDINAVLAASGGISGTVTDGAAGIQGINVTVYDNNNSWMGSASTDAFGDYIVGDLQTGAYKVKFSGSGYVTEWHNDRADFNSADPVSVIAPATTSGIDAVLVLGGGISGNVTDGTTGISGVVVVVFTHDNINSQMGLAFTNASGDYTLTGLPTGDYKVLFSGGSAGYLSEWFNDMPDFNSADLVTVTAPATTLGIDAVLTLAGSISGRVTDGSGAGISGLSVSASDSNVLLTRALTTTNANGDYTLRGLATGSYKVHFEANGIDFADEWYNDQVNFASADLVVVTEPDNTPGIDAVLSSPRKLSLTPVLMLLLNNSP